ncbi:MAG: hypothetical protein ACTSXJ_11495 [Candidatus Baldrarchaeia archaeon]
MAIAIVPIRETLNVGEDVILRFHPELNPLLESIKRRGWRYRFIDVTGSARVLLYLHRVFFKLNYYPPRIERFEERGTYTIETEVGENPPAVLNVESIDSFKISISTEHVCGCVTIDPLRRIITHIADVLWSGMKEDLSEKLVKAKEVHEVVQFLLDMGYALEDACTMERYKKIVDLLEGGYKFSLTIELTVEREEDVPSWEELKRDLSRFFRERGLLMEIKKEPRKGILPIFRKPIP